MTSDNFVIALDADLLKPRSISLWRRWKRLSSVERSLLVIFLLGLILFVYKTLHQNLDDEFRSFGYRGSLDDKANDHDGDGKIATPKVFLPDDLGLHEIQLDHPISQPSGKFKRTRGWGPKSPYPSLGPTNERSRAVVEAFKHSWRAYKKYAWGKDELLPISKSHSRWFGLGLTLVDALDTMYLMGLEEEFKESRNWVAQNLTFDSNSDVNLFECTIRILGGLLSAYHLSADGVFLEKAKQLGEKLMPAFTSNSPIPFSDVRLSNGVAHNPSWGSDSTTSEVSSIQLEFNDLSFLTGDRKFKAAVARVSEHLHSLSKRQGLVPIFVNANTGQFRHSATVTLGARGDSYYEYLLKIWLQTGNTMARDDYVEAMTGVENSLMRETSKSKLLYIGELLGGSSFSPKMDHLVCFLGGNLALAARNGLEPKKFMNFAKRLTDTCIELYRRMPTGLSPEIVHFSTQLEATIDKEIFVKTADSHNLQRPETVESLFYLYRLTGDKKYQDVGWEIFQAFEKYTKVEDGYTSIGNVQNPSNVLPRNKMESFWLAETLKYLYLLFVDDREYVSLDDFIFNTEGHLLPYLVRHRQSTSSPPTEGGVVHEDEDGI